MQASVHGRIGRDPEERQTKIGKPKHHRYRTRPVA